MGPGSVLDPGSQPHLIGPRDRTLPHWPIGPLRNWSSKCQCWSECFPHFHCHHNRNWDKVPTPHRKWSIESNSNEKKRFEFHHLKRLQWLFNYSLDTCHLMGEVDIRLILINQLKERVGLGCSLQISNCWLRNSFSVSQSNRSRGLLCIRELYC